MTSSSAMLAGKVVIVTGAAAGPMWAGELADALGVKAPHAR
jgi:hypothetical protein